MPTRSIFAVLASLAPLALPSVAGAQGQLLRSAQAIDDDFRGYCLDVAGTGENTRIDVALRTHSCKYRGDNRDQLFQWVDDFMGHVTMPEYDRCLEAADHEAGVELFVEPCGDTDLQAWTLSPTGQLSPKARPDLCVTIAAERSPAGTPSWISPVYHRRDVSLQVCDYAIAERQSLRWALEGEVPASLESTRRLAVRPDIVAGIRRIGNDMDPANMGKTQELLAELPRVYEEREIEMVTDIAYGPHEKHRLDIHTDNFRRPDNGELMPVVIFVHGGGFLFGAKENERNVPNYFASLGLVGVNMTYRLAPEGTFPAGALDVAAAVNWVFENIEDYGGDPNQIFVIGKSAGVEHVAAYVFRPDLLPTDIARVAGAVFLSGTFAPNADSPTRGELAYYGEDTSNWAQMGTLGNIERADIPVLITVSEFDPPVYQQSLARLIHELTIEHGRMPRVAQLLGHNHYSSNVSIGTTDDTVSSEIVEFIRATIERHD